MCNARIFTARTERVKLFDRKTILYFKLLLAPICFEFLFYSLKFYRRFSNLHKKAITIQMVKQFRYLILVKEIFFLLHSLLVKIVRETTIDNIYTSVCWLNDWMMWSDVKKFFAWHRNEKSDKKLSTCALGPNWIRSHFGFYSHSPLVYLSMRIWTSFPNCEMFEFAKWIPLRMGKAFLFIHWYLCIRRTGHPPHLEISSVCCVVLHGKYEFPTQHLNQFAQFAMNELRLSFSFPHSFPFIGVRICVSIQISFLLCLLWIVN